MAIDWGYPIVAFVLLFIVSSIYKKKTGRPLGELIKDFRGEGRNKVKDSIDNYRRVYVTKGIKQ